MKRKIIIGCIVLSFAITSFLATPAFAAYGWYDAKVVKAGLIGEGFYLYLTKPDDSYFSGNPGVELLKLVDSTSLNQKIAIVLTSMTSGKTVSVYMDDTVNSGRVFYIMINEE